MMVKILTSGFTNGFTDYFKKLLKNYIKTEMNFVSVASKFENIDLPWVSSVF